MLPKRIIPWPAAHINRALHSHKSKQTLPQKYLTWRDNERGQDRQKHYGIWTLKHTYIITRDPMQCSSTTSLHCVSLTTLCEALMWQTGVGYLLQHTWIKVGSVIKTDLLQCNKKNPIIPYYQYADVCCVLSVKFECYWRVSVEEGDREGSSFKGTEYTEGNTAGDGSFTNRVCQIPGISTLRPQGFDLVKQQDMN